MKSFKQFLEEQWEDVVGKFRTRCIHTTNIRGHHVEVSMEKANGGTHVDYKVNGSQDASQGRHHQTTHRIAIVRHVTKKIEEYVSSRKPPTILFAPANDEHDRQFTNFAKHIAKKYEYEHTMQPIHLVGNGLTIQSHKLTKIT